MKTPKNLLLRLLTLISGLFFIAFGVALSTKSGLGVSPSASVSYVLSLLLPLSMGTFTTLINVLFVIVQIVLLRKNYKPIQLLQLGVVLIFGYFTDFTLALVNGLTLNNYILRLFFCVLSCVIMAFGVFLEVKANLIVMASEGAISAICQVFGTEFGNVKMALDFGMIAIGAALSLIFLHTLTGIREGTIIAAFLVGIFVRIYNRRLTFVDRLLNAPAPDTGMVNAAETLPFVITIERELGSCGHELGERLARELGFDFVDQSLISEAMEKTGLSEHEIRNEEEHVSRSLYNTLVENSYAMSRNVSKQDAIFKAQSQIIRDYAAKGNCVIVGRLGGYVLKDRPNCCHVFLSGADEFRAQQIAELNKMKQEEALNLMHEEDRLRRNYCTHFTGKPWGLAHHYAVTLRTSDFGIDGTYDLLLKAVKEKLSAAPQK